MDVLYSFTKSLIDPMVMIVFLFTAATIAALSTRKRGVVLFLLPALVLLYGLSIAPVANGLCRFLEGDYILERSIPEGGVDVVVVLGGGTMESDDEGETRPSPSSASRLHYALQVFRESKATRLICAGKGTGRKTEAAVMARIAERVGVLRDQIIVDPVSRNTREHAEELDRLFRDKDVRIGLVTSAYHMNRSENEFRKYFSNVFPFPSDTLYSLPKGPWILSFIPNAGSLFKSAVALHEMTGILWYRLKRK